MWRCTGCRSPWCSTGPASPARTARVTTACGTARSCRWCRACGSPRDATRIAELLGEAVEVSDGPTVVRFPKGTVGAEVEAVGSLGRMDVLYRPDGPAAQDVLLIGAGPMAGACVEAAGRLADQGIGVTVIDPRWLKPLDEALVGAA